MRARSTTLLSRLSSFALTALCAMMIGPKFL
jgi:hypothetical protein